MRGSVICHLKTWETLLNKREWLVLTMNPFAAEKSISFSVYPKQNLGPIVLAAGYCRCEDCTIHLLPPKCIVLNCYQAVAGFQMQAFALRRIPTNNRLSKWFLEKGSHESSVQIGRKRIVLRQKIPMGLRLETQSNWIVESCL